MPTPLGLGNTARWSLLEDEEGWRLGLRWCKGRRCTLPMRDERQADYGGGGALAGVF